TLFGRAGDMSQNSHLDNLSFSTPILEGRLQRLPRACPEKERRSRRLNSRPSAWLPKRDWLGEHQTVSCQISLTTVGLEYLLQSSDDQSG
ncbi:MAG: hypothetical protein ABF382_01210, partial [Akkermansiaceae bacterium]